MSFALFIFINEMQPTLKVQIIVSLSSKMSQNPIL